MEYKCENNHIFVHTAKLIEPRGDGSIETPVCPRCGIVSYREYKTPESTIISVISVDIADVDSKLTEGYEVESLYAKTATLVKRTI